jgi:hypothetical protein
MDIDSLRQLWRLSYRINCSTLQFRSCKELLHCTKLGTAEIKFHVGLAVLATLMKSHKGDFEIFSMAQSVYIEPEASYLQ